LQRLRNKEKEQEKEKKRDEDFNRYRPMFPQSKVWKAKTADQPARSVGPLQPTSQASQTDRSDRSGQPVRPVEPSAEPAAESAPPVLVSSVDKAPAVPPTTEDEELVDYEASPERTNLEINVVHLSSDYFVVPEEDMAHLQFGPREAVFQRPSEKDNHLKALYMRGHINGKPVTHMLVDGGAL